jgi:hypothetical protein
MAFRTRSNEPSLDAMFLPELKRAMVKEACSRAASRFVDESGPWGRTQLAVWLLGSYASLTHYATVGGAADSSLPHPLSLLDMDGQSVAAIIEDARWTARRVQKTLESPSSDHGLVIATCRAGLVARFLDADGAIGWLPTNHARSLGDRVLSLLVAAHLAERGIRHPSQVALESAPETTFWRNAAA